MSARKIPHHTAIGTPSVIRNPWNGPMKLSAKKTMYTAPMIMMTPSMPAATGRGILRPALSRASPDE